MSTLDYGIVDIYVKSILNSLRLRTAFPNFVQFTCPLLWL